MKTLIKKARVVNRDKTAEADVFLSGEKIVKIGKNLKVAADKIIDAKGKHLLPGLIDVHTHLRAPGEEYKEDLISGAQAAAKGGFTTIFCMPNTLIPLDNEGWADFIRAQSIKIGKTEIFPVGAITKNRKGKELTEFNRLKKAGCLALSDDGVSVKNAEVLRRALEYAQPLDLRIISHCEDKDISSGGVVNEDAIAAKYGLPAFAEIAQTTVVMRDIELARYLGAPIHLAHINYKRSIELIRRAKKENIPVTCETAPHYFCLTSEDVEKNNFHPNFKVNPPLAAAKDVAAVKKALADGTIDCIATDHAPHSKRGKELGFRQAPFGFIGLELAFSLAYTFLVKESVLSLEGLVQKMAFMPAQIFNLSKRGEIKEGNWADLCLVNLDRSWQVRPCNLVSKSKNTPFLNFTLSGVVEQTIYHGKTIYIDKTA